MQNNTVCVFCPRMGMGDLISFMSLFKAINEHTKKQLIIITKSSTSGKHFLLNEPYCKDVIYLPNRKRGLINFYSNIKKNPSRYLPLKESESSLFNILSKKPLTPSKSEIYNNVRSRSAKLRYAIRNNNLFSNSVNSLFNK